MSHRTAHTPRRHISHKAPLSDEALLELVQRQTFAFFWDGAHPASGLARDWNGVPQEAPNDLVAIGGSGFGVMAIIVACARGWITRAQGLSRLSLMLDLLERAPCYHGLFPHFLNGATGATIPFSRKDDGGDIVETALLFQGLLCARQFFDSDVAIERTLRARITDLWIEVEWNWHQRSGARVLTWHWSPNNGFSRAYEIRGWNECLLTYVLAAAAPRYAIDASVYHDGWAQGRSFLNGHAYYGVDLPLGPPFGGPLFFSHFSFCGLDPRGLEDAYADYWRQNTSHVRIQIEHCLRNPQHYAGYGRVCWGLTASDDPDGYRPHAPDEDTGVIAPTAALASFPYAPEAALAAMRYFYEKLGAHIWGRYGFADAFSESVGWVSGRYYAINQGPIVAMIENYRTGLLWALFMKDPDVRRGLRRLGFSSPHLTEPCEVA